MFVLLVLAVFGIFLQNASANTSSCSIEDLRTCRADAITEMTSTGNDAGREETRCRGLRENFDCMVWQTSMCFKKEDQDSNSDIIWKTWRYLEGFCEKYGNWWANPCFQRDDIKRCESLLPSKRSSLDSQSCSMYLNFRECVLSIAESSCSTSDRSLVGTYFMQKGQQMAWRCPKDNDYASLSAASAQQVDRRYPEMYGDSSSSTGCTFNARNELDTCQARFRETQQEAQRRDDGDMRNHKQCCGLVHFEECVRDALNRRCSRQEVRRLTEDYVYPVRSRMNNACRDHTTYSCNSANSFIPQNSMPLYLAACVFYFLHVKRFF